MAARLLPRAFHPKARSHCPIAALGEALCDAASERGEMPRMALAAKEAFGGYRRAANAMNFDLYAWQAHKPFSRRTRIHW